MSGLQTPFSYDEQELLRHIPNEERARDLAKRLNDAASFMTRYAEGDSLRKSRQILAEAENLYRYCAGTADAMDEILLTMRHVGSAVDAVVEESTRETARRLSQLDASTVHIDLT